MGLLVGIGAVWAAGRRWPSFAAMPLPFKAFLLSGITGGTALTVADRASLAFERNRYGSAEEEKVVLPSDSDWKHKVHFQFNCVGSNCSLCCGPATIDGVTIID
jgi:hypothetical protein